jgi:hypothetical protein
VGKGILLSYSGGTNQNEVRGDIMTRSIQIGILILIVVMLLVACTKSVNNQIAQGKEDVHHLNVLVINPAPTPSHPVDIQAVSHINNKKMIVWIPGDYSAHTLFVTFDSIPCKVENISNIVTKEGNMTAVSVIR